MFVICGYNFCSDGNALDAAPCTTPSFDEVKIENTQADHWTVTREATSEPSTDAPSAWDYYTVMNATFNQTLFAGNVEVYKETIDGFKIKRRKLNEYNWITLKFISTSELEDLRFTFKDNLNQNLVDYEYAIVPVANGVEGNYIKNTVYSEFDGVFICDLETSYKLYSGVSYGNENRVQKTGIYEPYGRKYPIIVSNGATNYNTGSITGNVLPPDYMVTRVIDRKASIEEQNILKKFLSNKRAKILKDWNSRYYLVCFTGEIQTAFVSGTGMNLTKISANWAEIGDANSQADLFNSGMLEVSE